MCKSHNLLNQFKLYNKKLKRKRWDQVGYLGKSVDKMEGPPYLKPGLCNAHRTPLPVLSAFAAAGNGMATRTQR